MTSMSILFYRNTQEEIRHGIYVVGGMELLHRNTGMLMQWCVDTIDWGNGRVGRISGYSTTCGQINGTIPNQNTTVPRCDRKGHTHCPSIWRFHHHMALSSQSFWCRILGCTLLYTHWAFWTDTEKNQMHKRMDVEHSSSWFVVV